MNFIDGFNNGKSYKLMLIMANYVWKGCTRVLKNNI